VCNEGWTGTSGTRCDTCSHGYVGSQCQFTRRGTCHDHGDPQADGTCTCDSGYGGSQCQLSRANCNGHGDPKTDGTCTCDEVGYTGPNCQHTRQYSCANHGDPTYNGQCICDAGYIAYRPHNHISGCRQCSEARRGYSGINCTAAEPCVASSIHTDNGVYGEFYCINGGSIGGTTGKCTCSCNSGYSGTYCEHRIYIDVVWGLVFVVGVGGAAGFVYVCIKKKRSTQKLGTLEPLNATATQVRSAAVPTEPQVMAKLDSPENSVNSENSIQPDQVVPVF
jgi:hypothetical protein